MPTEPSGQNSGRDLALSLDRACLLRGGEEIRLRAKTFQVLLYLHEHQGTLVTKEDLFRAVWTDTFVSDDSLTKCIREIRHALGDDDHKLLKTVARRGFILDVRLVTVERAVQQHTHASPAHAADQRVHDLPAPLTSFVGRRREIAALVELLPATRLLTLTGAGGCGKTRLALEVARRMLDGFPGGVWMADLSPLADPALVVQAVASALDVRQAAGRSLVDTLSDHLRHRQVLLVLDNCEHVIDASAELAGTLLRAAAGLTILATSREALRIAGETTWRVPSLTVPEADIPIQTDDLLKYEAVDLLIQRAAAVGGGFPITANNAGAVAEVCRRLDGIPLAIELAAARLNVLSIEQIRARLDDRFRLLARTLRTPIERQRTLEATVDWSYELLAEPERQLLRRLSIFAGGWTLEAAEHVCSGRGIDRADVLDLLSHLVDKSLVMVDKATDGQRRFRYLETVRQYGWERLQRSSEADDVRARHLTFLVELTRLAEPQLLKVEQLHWLDRLRLEHANLRAALEWGLASDQGGPESVEMAGRLLWFWVKFAYLTEGQQWLERALARSQASAVGVRAQTFLALGSIVFFQGDFARTYELLEESAALAREACEPSIAAVALGLHTMAAIERQEFELGARLAAESAAAAREAGNPLLRGFSLTFFGYEALYKGDIDRAGRLHEEAVALNRAQGEIWGLAIVLFDLAVLRVVQHRLAESRVLCAEVIALGRQFRDRRAIAWAFGVLAAAYFGDGRPERAARLLGAMQVLLESIGSSTQPSYNALIGDHLFSALPRELGEDAYRQALAAGRAMSMSQAIDYALEEQIGWQPPAPEMSEFFPK